MTTIDTTPAPVQFATRLSEVLAERAEAPAPAPARVQFAAHIFAAFPHACQAIEAGHYPVGLAKRSMYDFDECCRAGRRAQRYARLAARCSAIIDTLVGDAYHAAVECHNAIYSGDEPRMGRAWRAADEAARAVSDALDDLADRGEYVWGDEDAAAVDAFEFGHLDC